MNSKYDRKRDIDNARYEAIRFQEKHKELTDYALLQIDAQNMLTAFFLMCGLKSEVVLDEAWTLFCLFYGDTDETREMFAACIKHVTAKAGQILAVASNKK